MSLAVTLLSNSAGFGVIVVYFCCFLVLTEVHGQSQHLHSTDKSVTIFVSSVDIFVLQVAVSKTYTNH